VLGQILISRLKKNRYVENAFESFVDVLLMLCSTQFFLPTNFMCTCAPRETGQISFRVLPGYLSSLSYSLARLHIFSLVAP
jgi:hypothetical protein